MTPREWAGLLESKAAPPPHSTTDFSAPMLETEVILAVSLRQEPMTRPECPVVVTRPCAHTIAYRRYDFAVYGADRESCIPAPSGHVALNRVPISGAKHSAQRQSVGCLGVGGPAGKVRIICSRGKLALAVVNNPIPIDIMRIPSRYVDTVGDLIRVAVVFGCAKICEI